MYWYSIDGKRAASLEEAPLPPAGEGVPELFLVRGDPVSRPAVWHVTDPRQLTAEDADIRWLDPRRMGDRPELPEAVSSAAAGRLTGVNLQHPRWRRALDFTVHRPGKRRVHLLAVGDVGGTLLTALKQIGRASCRERV